MQAQIRTNVQADPQRVTENSFTDVELQQAYRCVRLLYPKASQEIVIDITSLQLYDLKYMGYSQDSIMMRHKWTTKRVNECVHALPVYYEPHKSAAALHYDISKRDLYNLNRKWPNTRNIFPTFPIRMEKNPVKERILQLRVLLEIHPEQRDCFFTNYELAQAYQHLSAVYPDPDGRRKNRGLLMMAAAMQLDYLRGVCKSEYLLIAHEYITEEIHKLVANYEVDYSSISERNDLHEYRNKFLEFKHWDLGYDGAMAKIVLNPSWLSPTLFRVTFANLVRRKPSAEKSDDTLEQMMKLDRWLELKSEDCTLSAVRS